MQLIRENRSSAVSNDTVVEFETILLESGTDFRLAKLRKYCYTLIFFFFRLCRKLGKEYLMDTKPKWKNPLKDPSHLFVIMMNLNEYKIRPYVLFNKHGRSVYLFDAWPKDHEKIIQFVNRYKIDFLFVSSNQASEKLNTFASKTHIHWIPEGIDPALYRHKPYSERNIDVLALGRKYDWYHESICQALQDECYVYLYEKVKGNLIFATREDFIKGLSDSKISICVPSSITHPERAGDICTMTIRYLQSMVSKCLIVGFAPNEMITLFGYNPVVEIDMENPVAQIRDILANFEAYIPLIEKNYEAVLSRHSWSHRWQQIRTIYSNNN